MASVHQKDRSPFWMAKFRADDGRTVMRSTKQTKRAAAQLIANEWERAAKKARAGELTQAVILKTLGEMLERGLGEQLIVQSTRDFFAHWTRMPGRKASTLKRYEPILDGFLKAIGPRRAAASIGSMSATEIAQFRDQQIKEGKAATTANLAVTVLRSVFTSARRLGLALSNPAEAVELLDSSDAEERIPFTVDHTRDLLRVADVEWRGMILFGYHTGIRLHDAANLTWQNIDLAARTLTFRDAKTSARKRRSKRDTVVYLHTDLIAYLESLPTSDDPQAPLFPSLFGKASGSYAGLSNSFNRVMAKAEIRAPLGVEKSGKGRQFKQLGFHSFRHTLISNLANADISADVRKEIAGHADDEIHRRYVHLDISAQQRAIHKIGSVLT
ncbi:MAG: tyrosine-type recombinase/integrase [Chthoniobacterales bacterium]